MSNSKTSATKPAKKSPKATATSSSTAKAFKSAELIVDSDEDEGPAEKSSAKSQAVPTKSNGASLSLIKEKASTGLKPSSSKPTKRPKPLTPSTSDGNSNAHSADKATSDPRRGSAFSNRSNIPPKPSVGAPSSTSRPSLKRKSPSASTSVTESSEDEIKPDGSPTPHKRPKLSPTPQPISKRANSTASKQQTRESESTDTSQSGSEEESETGSENGSHESSQSGNDEERPQATSKKSIPQPSLLPYAPPPDFEPATISSHASASHTELFSPSNLQGKQIWHIAIPSSVPVTSITSVGKKSVQDGSAVMSYKGADYGLIPEAENQAKNTVLLLPSDEEDRYKPANTRIMQTLHLQQLVSLPSIAHDVGAEDAGTQVGGTVTVRKSHEKPAPEQPKGLRMRYKPIGVEDSDDPDANSRPSGAQKAPDFRVPTLAASSRSPKKRKHDEVIDPDTDDDISPTKKTAKSKPAGKSSGRVEMQEDARPTQENGTGSSLVNKSSKKEKHRKDHSTPKDPLSGRHVTTNGNGAEPSPSKKDKLTNPSIEIQSSSPKKQRRKHKTISSIDETPREVSSTEPTAKKQVVDPGQLSKKSKIPGETVEERKIRRAEKKRQKEAAEANSM